MAAFSHKSPDDNYLLSTGHNCGISDTSLPSRVPKLTFIQPSVDFHRTSPLTVSAASYPLEPQYSYPGTNTIVARETEEYSLQKLDSREIDEDIHKLFVETNVFGIDELYSNNIPPDVSMIFDEAIATTDSKEVVEDKRRKNNRVDYRACRINSRMATAIKPCNSSAASTKEKTYKGKKITESSPKQPTMPEPAKDFVLVRARRGQATDRHSIAERARREKIRKRMNYLQDLVPGCGKGTGKTVILDEIINYVKSLQNQVEFLSMKLSAASPRYDFSLEPGNHDLGYTEARPAQEYCGGTVQGSTPDEQLDMVFDPSTNASCFTFAQESTGADECDPQLQLHSLVHGRLRQQDRNHEMAHVLGFSQHH